MQRAMLSFYVALAIFVATSVAIALAAVAHDYTWVAVGLGMVGVFFMLYASVLLSSSRAWRSARS